MPPDGPVAHETAHIECRIKTVDTGSCVRLPVARNAPPTAIPERAPRPRARECAAYPVGPAETPQEERTTRPLVPVQEVTA
ncbi:hypothetical protein ACF1G0_22160 [Streptomyces sp. NPDC013953]|uniref:hypothetical protein n=1 Tax=Streptomyces sp. NPDC013953 TaxID=3364868 RepID=UPI0036F9E4D1